MAQKKITIRQLDTNLGTGVQKKLLSGTVSGQILVWNNTTGEWEIGNAPASTLNDATDVTLTSLADNNILRYNSGTSQWENEVLNVAAVDGLQTALDLKADLASPTFTGTPTAPTAAPNTNTTQVATTAYVDAAAAAVAAGAASALNDLTDVTVTSVADNNILRYDSGTSQWVNEVLNVAAVDGLQTALDLKADLVSPALTGTPTAPTAAANTNTTQVATTAFVTAAAAAVASTQISKLVDLTDVNLTGAADGTLLRWATSGGSLKLIATTLTTADVPSVFTRTDANAVINTVWTHNNPVILDYNITNSLHAVNKGYVDGLAQGLRVRDEVLVASTANFAGTLSGAVLTASANGAISIDGVSLTVGQTVLLKDQTSALQNGVYAVTTVGDGSNPAVLTRTAPWDESNEISASFVFVQDGTQAGTGWVAVVDNPTTFAINTDAINFTQFSGAGSYIGGAGMVLAGNTFNVQTASTGRIVVNADDIDLAMVGTAGTYKSVTTDAYGRVTAGSTTQNLSSLDDVNIPGGSTAGSVLVYDGSEFNLVANPNIPKYGVVTATASQTTVNTGSVPAKADTGGLSFMQVFVNGVKLRQGSGFGYTVTGASEITLVDALDAGDEVEFYAFAQNIGGV